MKSNFESRPLTSVEAALKFLAKLERHPSVFIGVQPKVLLAAARESDLRWEAGRPFSPHDGELVAIKDNIDVSGYQTTLGSEVFAEASVKQKDAIVVKNLRNAGFVIAGKTNMSEFAFSGLGTNAFFGTPMSAGRGSDLVPGGSSSGSAIAIQSGLVSFALGTDTAGSVRIPAAFNDICGFRPSRGRYCLNGVAALAQSFDTLGPMARSVAEIKLLDRYMLGQNPESQEEFRPLRLVYDTSLLKSLSVTDDVAKQYLAALDTLSTNGVSIDPVDADYLKEAHDLIARKGWPGSFEAYANFKHYLHSPDRSKLDPNVALRLERAAAFPNSVYDDLMAKRADLMQQADRKLKNCQIVLPTVKHVAPTIDAALSSPDQFAAINALILSLTWLASYLDMPTVALPVRQQIGAPLASISISATRLNDTSVLNAALHIERVLN